ncbi:MAG: 5'/3'-nucleotidase SurE [Anaerolineae bacterium]|nr:5'/3'-nucleotidase SurE [Anaerolineae bacterium]
MKDRPRILVSNDDGIRAPGLLALVDSLRAVGEVAVVAPERNWSAVGHTKTMHKPLRASEVALLDGVTAYQTNGSPSDCVALAILGLVRRRLDLVVSGINEGANVGTDILYSGTFAAAAEATIAGISAFSISLDTSLSATPFHNYRQAALFAAELARRILEAQADRPWLLNVNVPDLPGDQLQGVEITRLGQRIYQDALVERLDPRGRRYYWIGGQVPGGVVEEGTDIGALAASRISVTPVRLDLTDHMRLEELRTWSLGEGART